MKRLGQHRLAGLLFAVLLGLLSAAGARADLIFVASFGPGTIGEYTTAGATVNPALISGLSTPPGIALSGSDLFGTNQFAGAGRAGVCSYAGAASDRVIGSSLRIPVAIARS